MNKKLLLVSAVAVLATLHVKAQTKIGNNPASLNPNALLELESTNKGTLLTRLALNSTESPTPLTLHVAGMIVYNTATSATINATAVTPGYYYNDGAKWLRIGVANAVFNNPTNNRVELATTSTGTARTAGTEVVFLDNGNVGIGITNPSADLDVNGTVRVRNLGAGATGDQVVTTDANGNLRKVSASSFITGAETKVAAGNNITVTGTGAAATPYVISASDATAVTTSSTAITASSTTVAVSATNVQGAISDLATAIITNKANGSETKISNTGSTVIVSGTGTTADPYKLNTTALTTPSTAVTASATSVAVSSTNVQGAINDLATAIVANKVKLAAGTNTTLSGTGTTADPYKVNTAFQDAASTPNTVINASSTSVNVPAGNVQNALASLATSIAGRDGTDDAWVNNTTTNVVELKTKSNGTTTRSNGTQFIVQDNGSTVIGSGKLNYPSRLTLVSDNISVAGSSYLNDNLEVLSFGNNANNSPYPVVDISSSFGTEAAPANFPSGSTGVGAVRWNARAGGNKVEVARIGVTYVGNGTTNLSEMTFTTSGNDNQLVLSSNGGVGVGIKTTTSSFAVDGLKHYNDNNAAKSGGLKVGDFYRTVGDVRVVY